MWAKMVNFSGPENNRLDSFILIKSFSSFRLDSTSSIFRATRKKLEFIQLVRTEEVRSSGFFFGCLALRCCYAMLHLLS